MQDIPYATTIHAITKHILHLPHRKMAGWCGVVFQSLGEFWVHNKSPCHIWVGDWNRFAPTQPDSLPVLGAVECFPLIGGGEDRQHKI